MNQYKNCVWSAGIRNKKIIIIIANRIGSNIRHLYTFLLSSESREEKETKYWIRIYTNEKLIFISVRSVFYKAPYRSVSSNSTIKYSISYSTLDSRLLTFDVLQWSVAFWCRLIMSAFLTLFFSNSVFLQPLVTLSMSFMIAFQIDAFLHII